MPAKDKAQVASVDFGAFTIEGLMLTDGTYAVSVPQISELFQIDKNQASRELKTLLGGGVQIDKSTSVLHPKAVNILSLSQVELVVAKLSFKGNTIAQQFVLDSVALSLVQRFSDAFGVKFEKDDRDKEAESRRLSKILRLNLTDEIKRYLDASDLSENAKKFMYSNCSDLLNRLLTGYTAKYWRDKFELADNDALRDYWGSPHLDRVKAAEDLAARKIHKGMEPMEAIASAVEALMYEVWLEDDLLGKKDVKTQTRNRSRKFRKVDPDA